MKARAIESADRDRVREAAEDRLQQLRQRGLAEEADADRGERDPDLAGGDELVDVVELLERQRGAADAFVAQLLEPLAARADDRELGRDEEAVDRDQTAAAGRAGGRSSAMRPGTSGWDVLGHSALGI